MLDYDMMTAIDEEMLQLDNNKALNFVDQITVKAGSLKKFNKRNAKSVRPPVESYNMKRNKTSPP